MSMDGFLICVIINNGFINFLLVWDCDGKNLFFILYIRYNFNLYMVFVIGGWLKFLLGERGFNIGGVMLLNG